MIHLFEKYENIAKMTDRNLHTEAIIAGAKELKFTALVKKAELVLQLQKMEGHMPSGLGAYKGYLQKQLMDYAKQELSPEDYKAFQGSF